MYQGSIYDNIVVAQEMLGRSIHDNIVVAQEMTHIMIKMKGNMSYFVIKINLTKAYDMLNCYFIENILKEVEFSLELITFIITFTGIK